MIQRAKYWLMMCVMWVVPSWSVAAPIEMTDLREDVQRVIHAITTNLKASDDKDVAAVTFDGIDELSDGTKLNYEHFYINKISVLRDMNQNGNRNDRVLEFLLELVDPGLRRSLLHVTSQYIATEESIDMKSLSIEPVYMSEASATTYFLDASELPELKKWGKLTFPQFMSMVSDYLISADELNDIPTGESRDIALVAISDYRYEPGATLSVFASGAGVTDLMQVKESAEWNISGWPITVVRGMMQLNTKPGFEFAIGLTRKIDGKNVGIPVEAFPSIF